MSIYGRDFTCDHGEPLGAECTQCTGGTAVIAGEVLDVTNQAWCADWLRANLGKGKLSGVFRRAAANVLVHTPMIGEDGYQPLRGAEGVEDDGPTQIRPLQAQEIAARIQYGWSCVRYRKVGETRKQSPGLFPLAAAKVAEAAPDLLLSVRQLRGVVGTPIVRKNGSVFAEPGYDDDTHLIYLPTGGLQVPPVPEAPNAAQVRAAADRILFILSDFPFETDHDRAGYIGAALLTPLMRDLTPPPYKALAINARQMGSGKSLLAHVGRILHGGVMRSEMPEDDAELRKQITTILDMTTAPLVNFDNVTGVLKSGTLAGLLTSRDWDDRRLGANELARCVNDRLWMFTGNNVQLGGDLVRRVVWASIDPGMPNPERRTGFKIPDLTGYVTENRGQIIGDLLTLIRAWVVAGKPATVTSYDDFGQWIAAVNGILRVAGIPGTFDAQEARQQEEGSDDQDWAEFLEAVEHIFGDDRWSAREVCERVSMSGNQLGGVVSLGVDQLPGNLGERAQKLGSAKLLGKSLGRHLQNRKGRFCGGRAAVEDGKDRNGKLWRIRRHDRQG